MPSLAIVLALGLVASCGDETRGEPTSATVRVDSLLTLAAAIGGDPIVTGVVTHCQGSPPARALSNGATLASADAALIYELGRTAEDSRWVFQLTIPAARLDPARFGLPVDIDLQLEIQCGDTWVRSEPYPMTYVPAAASATPAAFNYRRFWPATAEGDVLACGEGTLQHFANSIDMVAEVAIGFSCAAAELPGSPASRRYLSNEGAGIAAVDPGPSVSWTRQLDLVAYSAEAEAEQNPVVIYRDAGDRHLVVLDHMDGTNLTSPVLLTDLSYGRPVRDEGGDLLVLVGKRPPDLSTLTYFVDRYDAAASPLGRTEVVHYGWNAPSYIAEYDPDAAYLYVTAAPNGDEVRWLDKIDVTTGSSVWPSAAAGHPWTIPLGEAYGRLLAASDTGFAWLDPVDGRALTTEFGPDSGNQFLRGAVEEDGSVIMLGDPDGAIAHGVYLFAPDGTTTLRFTRRDGLFRWLTSAWGNGILVSYYSQLHLLHPRATYTSMRDAPSE